MNEQSQPRPEFAARKPTPQPPTDPQHDEDDPAPRRPMASRSSGVVRKVPVTVLVAYIAGRVPKPDALKLETDLRKTVASASTAIKTLKVTPAGGATFNVLLVSNRSRPNEVRRIARFLAADERIKSVVGFKGMREATASLKSPSQPPRSAVKQSTPAPRKITRRREQD